MEKDIQTSYNREQASFDLEVITPLFMAGASQKKDELRPPSFRGLLRYWYRALVGGVYGGNMALLREREARVFGTTERGSPVSVRISAIRRQPQSDRGKDVQNSLAMLIMPKGQGRPYLPEGSSFQLTLTACTSEQTDPEGKVRRQILAEAVTALWLLTNLGGSGARARHGGGNLEARLLHAPANLPSPFTLGTRPLASRDALDDYLRAGLQQARELIREGPGESAPAASSRTSWPSWDSLLPKACHICTLPPEGTWSDVGTALKEITTRYRLPQEAHKRRQPSPLHLRLARTQAGIVGIAVLFQVHSSENEDDSPVQKFLMSTSCKEIDL